MPLDWTPLVDVVSRCQRFAITTHVRPDPDALGSQLAIGTVLEAMGKQTHLVISSKWPPRYDFMDPARRIARYPADGVDYSSFDAIIVVDTGTWNQIGDFGECMRTSKAVKVVIDHHVSQDDLGAIRLVDVSAEAAARLIVEAVDALRQPITSEIANSLFAALATDTGWFRHRNTTPATFALAERLAKHGADPNALYEAIYENNKLPRLRLLGLVLQRLQLLEGGKIAVTEVRREDYEVTGAIPQDTEDMVQHTRSIAGVEVGLFFLEQPAGGVKVSFRARSLVNVAAVAEKFGGGGHKLASGAILMCSLEETKRRVLGEVSKALLVAGL